MKNKILFFNLFLCGMASNLCCSIEKIVQELSVVPLYDIASLLRFQTMNERLLGQEGSNKKYSALFENWVKEVNNENGYVELINKYFTLFYHGSRNNMMNIINVNKEEPYITKLCKFIRGYVGNDEDFTDNYFQKIKPILSSESKKILEQANKIEDNKALFDFIKDKKNKKPLIYDLTLINKFGRNTFDLWEYNLGDYSFEELGKHYKIGVISTDPGGCIALLVNTISERNISNNDAISRILKNIKNIENRILWRGLLFYFDPYAELTADYVRKFFENNIFPGMQFKDVKTIYDIRTLINDRINFFQEKINILKTRIMPEEEARPFCFGRRLYKFVEDSVTEDKQNKKKNENNYSSTLSVYERYWSVNDPSGDQGALWGKMYFNTPEIKNFERRIKVLEDDLVIINSMIKQKNAYWLLSMFLIAGSGFGVGALFAWAQNKGYSLNPQVWWQKFKNR